MTTLIPLLILIVSLIARAEPPKKDDKPIGHPRFEETLREISVDASPRRLRPFWLTGPGHAKKQRAIEGLMRVCEIDCPQVFRPGSQLKLLFSIKLQENSELSLALQMTHLQRLVERMAQTKTKGLVILESIDSNPSYLTKEFLDLVLRLHTTGDAQTSGFETLTPAQLLIVATTQTCLVPSMQDLRKRSQAFHFSGEDCPLF